MLFPKYCATVMWFLSAVAVTLSDSKYPLDFEDSDFFLTSRKGGPPSEVIEDIRRGQEGVLVKLRQVTDELENDELKLNNIFYKLGHHDTELKTVSNGLGRLSAMGRKTDAKLNKHSFNVEFLHQQVQEMKRKLENQDDAQDKILDLQKMILHLEDRLSQKNDKLSRKITDSQLPKKYESGRNLEHLEAAPISYIHYPLNDQGSCPKDWDSYEDRCYFVSEDMRPFRLAIASCTDVGGTLISLNHTKTLALNKIFKKSGDEFWTSATDIYSPQQWHFLLSGNLVQRQLWFNYHTVHLKSTKGNHCGVWTKRGLAPINCSHRKRYICEKI